MAAPPACGRAPSISTLAPPDTPTCRLDCNSRVASPLFTFLPHPTLQDRRPHRRHLLRSSDIPGTVMTPSNRLLDLGLTTYIVAKLLATIGPGSYELIVTLKLLFVRTRFGRGFDQAPF